MTLSGPLFPLLAGRSGAAASWAVGLVAAASMVAFLVYTVPQPWNPLVFPTPPPAAGLRAYVPIVAQIIGQARGEVDGFGRPLGH